MNALKNQVVWRCRRGLLELDLFFVRFIDTRLDTLAEQELREMLDLLSAEDHELWAMLNGSVECTTEKWQRSVSLLRQSGS